MPLSQFDFENGIRVPNLSEAEQRILILKPYNYDNQTTNIAFSPNGFDLFFL